MYIDTKETAFLHDLSKPSLEALSHVLRHKEMWPKGFEWNYAKCHTCAMGMAHRLWKMKIEWDPRISTRLAAEYFDMPPSAATQIFNGPCGVPSTTDSEGFVHFNAKSVTPEMVADQIDQYLASRKG